MITELTTQDRAVKAINGNDKELIELASKSKQVTKVENDSERIEAHNFLMTLVKTRTDLEKTGKAARDDANVYIKAVIAEENRLIALISGEESRLKELRDSFDAKVKAEKEKAANAEFVRIDNIKNRLFDLEPNLIFGANSEFIQKRINEVESIEVDATFFEFAESAKTVKFKTLDFLMAHLKAAKDGKSLKAEIEKLRADAQARAEAEYEAKAKADAEAAARMKAEQEEITRIAAQLREEQAKIAAWAQHQAEVAEKAALDAHCAAEAAEAERVRIENLPDKEKLLTFFEFAMPYPEVKSDIAKNILKQLYIDYENANSKARNVINTKM